MMDPREDYGPRTDAGALGDLPEPERPAAPGQRTRRDLHQIARRGNRADKVAKRLRKARRMPR